MPESRLTPRRLISSALISDDISNIWTLREKKLPPALKQSTKRRIFGGPPKKEKERKNKSNNKKHFLLFDLFFFLLIVLRLFISQPIAVKLRTQIADNVLQNGTVSDFQVRS